MTWKSESQKVGVSRTIFLFILFSFFPRFYRCLRVSSISIKPPPPPHLPTSFLSQRWQKQCKCAVFNFISMCFLCSLCCPFFVPVVVCVWMSSIAMVSLPNVASKGNHYLYTTEYNYVDLSADENGIWAIYTAPYSTHTNVVKVCMS